MTLYLDASCLVPLFVTEPASMTVADLLRESDDPLVSDFAAGEFASALSRKVREGGLHAAGANTALDGFDEWVAEAGTWVECTALDLRRADQLVRRFELKLRFPDAIHIATCERHSARLVTRDKLMADAADVLQLHVLYLL